MTTLVCWKSVDATGRETMHLCADSRFSDGKGATWDYGRKLFYSHEFPDVFAFVGEVLPPQTVLGQLVDAIDSESLGKRPTDPKQRMKLYKSYLDRTVGSYPKVGSVEIFFGTRHDNQSVSTFRLWRIEYGTGTGPVKEIEVPSGTKTSRLIGVYGSGKKKFKEHYDINRAKPQGETSRAIYWSFVDHLASGKDHWTGGPPQIVRLGHKGSAKPVGISYNGGRYLFGLELNKRDLSKTKVKEWHDEKYQFIDPVTGSPRSNAQKIRRP